MFLNDAYRRGLAVAVVAAVIVAGTGAAGAGWQQEAERKLDKDQRLNAEAAVRLVDAVMTGQAEDGAPAFTIGWTNDFLKAQEGRIYVPFTVSIDTSALSTRNVTFYLRVVSRAAAPAAPDGKQEPAPYAFEDVWFPELQKPPAGQPYRFSRAFAVPAGDYDVFVAVREWSKDDKKAPNASVLKQPTTVPDYWNGELATSSIIVAQDVQQLTAPLSPAEQAEHPYTIGSMQLTPSFSDTFTTAQELSVVFLVYNPALKDNKPDIQVEYKFHQKTADGEQYFNRTAPTVLNADTLGPAWDLNAGYQLVAGQSVPLASFPPGDYRLEIEVQDKLAETALTRDVRFTVTGS